MLRRANLLLLVMWTAGAFAAEPFKADPPDLYKYVERWPILQYPQVAQTFHKTGVGWYYVQIDRASGRVTQVKVLQSTGTKVLDDNAAVAFLQACFKPNTLDHAVVSIDYRAPKYPKIGSHLPW